MSYSELFVALETIIIDNVATVPTARSRKNDTSAPMESGMAGKRRWRECEPRGRQRWQRWQRWTEELVAERQRQERKQRATERWQWKNQNMLDV